jgi:hypothetical protein
MFIKKYNKLLQFLSKSNFFYYNMFDIVNIDFFTHVGIFMLIVFKHNIYIITLYFCLLIILNI